MLAPPVGQEGTQFGIAQRLFLFLIALDIESQRLVIDEAARASELPQVAELLGVWSKFEFVCLQSQHQPRLLAYEAVKRYPSRQALRFLDRKSTRLNSSHLVISY